jgi:hypothetical protein
MPGQNFRPIFVSSLLVFETAHPAAGAQYLDGAEQPAIFGGMGK